MLKFIFAAFIGLTFMSAQADEAMLYGKITLKDGKTYKGAMMWGKHEVLWQDIFNGTKAHNRYAKYERSDRYDRKWRMFGNARVNSKVSHQFTVQFGDIKAIEPNGKKYATVILKDNSEHEIKRGSANDVGETIRIMDDYGDVLKIKWRKIRRIEFEDHPGDLKYRFGTPLYGTVKTEIGSFSGYVRWDNDELFDAEELNGEDEEGTDRSIKFRAIKEIERMGSISSKITLKSGRTIELSGTNDVNKKNRGIVIYSQDIGVIQIRWRDFDKVTFSDAPTSPQNHSDFDDVKPLEGDIKLKDSRSDVSAKFIFDIDESVTAEILDGKLDENKFEIPFRNIARIERVSRYTVNVILKNGMSFRLSDTQDVNHRNGGILMISGTNRIIEWGEVETVEFD